MGDGRSVNNQQTECWTGGFHSQSLKAFREWNFSERETKTFIASIYLLNFLSILKERLATLRSQIERLKFHELFTVNSKAPVLAILKRTQKCPWIEKFLKQLAFSTVTPHVKADMNFQRAGADNFESFIVCLNWFCTSWLPLYLDQFISIFVELGTVVNCKQSSLIC